MVVASASAIASAIAGAIAGAGASKLVLFVFEPVPSYSRMDMALLAAFSTWRFGPHPRIPTNSPFRRNLSNQTLQSDATWWLTVPF
mmetsp:Transcript_16042/g.36990  ORF Transcript_16042/g.36990 Transcript_16042/m.36990 type:complete len:86 (+) Transcript_16042:965-1222(+)